ncbi:paratose synthase [Odoribacter laneus]|jgi:CDP-abequose synthase|uniref:NAD-dependent epimerase/dehydratase family protein n=1 Tax=Odoribacter laneus TaxID=626933 RepID=UPI00189B6187|nr:NAD(P)-dependent oxidoreductase [Odoribacter laneus]GKI20771.1 paratose synthase [Odoribacter laneus]GKI24035.1 paratose synthase [Odoribacter laneus]
MNILITGATGFVGRHLVRKLKKDFSLHLLVREGSDLTGLEDIPAFCFKEDIPALRQYLNKEKIEGIVHLASLYIAQHREEQIKDIILSNVYFGTALLEAASKSEVKWFLNTGTIWQNYESDSPEYCPVNLYAASKQAFIDIAQYYTAVSPLRFMTLKLCDTYGPWDTRTKILALFKRIAETGEELAMSPGEQQIDLLHIDDVIAGFRVLIRRLSEEKEQGEEYVLRADRPCSLRELAAVFEHVSGKKLNIIWGGREYRLREVMCPWKRGTVLPDWQPQISLQEGISDLLQHN